MESLKKESLDAIAKLPDSATIDDIMYHPFVIDKIRKGKEAVAHSQTITVQDLRNEVEQW